jgi:hypothetical protein
MIARIYANDALAPFLKKECCENDVCITFADEVGQELYVVIKVDDYYNALGLTRTPAAPDCLIIRQCLDGGYGLTIGELKSITSSGNFDLKNMLEKFETCIEDFIKVRFRDLLYKDYKDLKLYFVSNIEIYKRDLGLKMEVLINKKFDYNGRRYMIQPKMPHPAIKNCY